MDNALEEINKAQGVPQTNKKVNEKLFKKEQDFLERVKNDQQRT